MGRTLIHHLCLAKSTPENTRVLNFILAITNPYAYEFNQLEKKPFSQPDKNGITPLHLALQFGSLSKARWLLEKIGLNLQNETCDGRNSLDFIVLNQDRALYALIQDAEINKGNYNDNLYSELNPGFSRYSLYFDCPPLSESAPKVFDCYFKMRKKHSPQSQFEALCLVYLLDRPTIRHILPHLDLYAAYKFFNQAQLGESLELKESSEPTPIQVFREIAKKETQFKLDEPVLKQYIHAKLLLASSKMYDKEAGIEMLASLFEKEGLSLILLLRSEMEGWSREKMGIAFLAPCMRKALAKINKEEESISLNVQNTMHPTF